MLLYNFKLQALQKEFFEAIQLKEKLQTCRLHSTDSSTFPFRPWTFLTSITYNKVYNSQSVVFITYLRHVKSVVLTVKMIFPEVGLTSPIPTDGGVACVLQILMINVFWISQEVWGLMLRVNCLLPASPSAQDRSPEVVWISPEPKLMSLVSSRGKLGLFGPMIHHWI